MIRRREETGMRELPLPDRILTAFLFRPQGFQHHSMVELSL
jgi:hypothetical protein